MTKDTLLTENKGVEEDHIELKTKEEKGEEEEERKETYVDKLLVSSINMTEEQMNEIKIEDELEEPALINQRQKKKKWYLLNKFKEQLFPEDVEHIWGKENVLNVIRTILYCLSYVYMGLIISEIGPAITTLRRATSSTKDEMGYVFLTRGFGFIFGALLGGKMIDVTLNFASSELRKTQINIDHMEENELQEVEEQDGEEEGENELQEEEQQRRSTTNQRRVTSVRLSQHVELRGVNFFRTTHQLRMETIKHYLKLALRNSHWIVAANHIVLAVFNILIPFIRNYWIFLILHIFLGFGAAFIDVWGNTIPSYLWKEKANPWLQLLHFQFSVGATIAPFVMSLCFRYIARDEVSLMVSFGAFSVYGVLLSLIYILLPSPQINLKKQSIHIIESQSKEHINEVQVEMDDPTESENTVSFRTKLKNKWQKLRSIKARDVIKNAYKTFITDGGWIYLAMALMLGLYVGDEIAVGGLISSHVEDAGLMSKEDGALLAFAFWIALTIGRFLGIVVSLFLSPAIMLLCNLIGSLAASVIVLIFPTNIYVIWASTILIGLFLASTFPTAIAFPTISGGAKMSGTLTSIMVVGASLGEMMIPVLGTRLMVTFAKRGLFITVTSIVFAATLVLGLTLIIVYTKRIVHFLKHRKLKHKKMEEI